MKSVSYLFFFFCLLLSGCATMYIPSPVNTPMLEKKGEVHIEAGVSTNSIFANGSYAFSEKYALITNSNLSFRNFSEIYDLGDFRSYSETTIFLGGGHAVAHRSVEAGLGRYNMLPASKRPLEMFAGIGYGVANNDKKDFYSRYFNGFIQINRGKKYKNFEMGWSFYAKYVYFINYKHIVYIPVPDNFDSKEIRYSNFSLIHPGALMFMNLGGEHLKVSIRHGINLPFPLSSNCPIETNSVDGINTIFHFSIGLCYRF